MKDPAVAATSVKRGCPTARRMRGLAAGLVLAFLLLAGCSDTDDAGDAGSSSTDSLTGTGNATAGDEVNLEVASTGAYPANPGFSPEAMSVPAGALVHVTFSNGDAVPVIQHNWVVEGIADAGSETVGPGEQSMFDFTAPAEAGEFAFYCSVGDHRDRGMEGTLTVTA